MSARPTAGDLFQAAEDQLRQCSKLRVAPAGRAETQSLAAALSRAAAVLSRLIEDVVPAAGFTVRDLAFMGGRVRAAAQARGALAAAAAAMRTVAGPHADRPSRGQAAALAAGAADALAAARDLLNTHF